MAEQNHFEAAISRRGFLKSAAVSAGAVATGSALANVSVATAESATSAGETVQAGICRANCDGGCFLNVTVRDGKVVNTAARELPDPAYTRICSKGFTHAMRINSPERVKYPMKRVGERGSSDFERISWEQAIKEIGEIWRTIREESGPGAVAMTTGSGNYGCINGVGGPDPQNMLIGAAGFTHLNLGYDLAHGLAMNRMVGYGRGSALSEPKDILNAKTIFVWGANPAVSQPHMIHFITEAKEKGAYVVDIDVIYNTTASLCDEFVAINPGTDGALAMAMMNEIFQNGWQDEEFLKAYSTAPFIVKEDGMLMRMSDLGVEPALGDINTATGQPTVIDLQAVCNEAGEFVSVAECPNPVLELSERQWNGQQVCTGFEKVKEAVSSYTPEYAEGITGVPADTIRRLAEIYAISGPATIYTTFGQNHYSNGHYNIYDTYSLSALCGNYGKHGAGCGQFQVTATNPYNLAATAPEGIPGASAVVQTQLVNEALDAKEWLGQPIDLRAWLITCSDTMNNNVNQNYMQEAMNRFENIVVMDMVMTDTAKYADYILPVAHWFEKRDLMWSWHNHPFMMYQDAIVEPQFEAKPDFEIIKLLANEIGAGEFYNFTEDEWMERVLDTDEARSLGITPTAMKEQHAIRALPGEVFVAWDPETNPYLTPSGRAEIYVEAPWAMYNAGQELDFTNEHVAYWEPSREADLNSAAAAAYPYHAVAERSRFRTHVQWWDVETLLEIEPRPTIKINPDEAKDLGIADGDLIRIKNDRGEMTAHCQYHAGLSRKTVMVPKGWQRHQIPEGHWNAITDTYMSPMVNNCNFNDVRVNIEKA